MRTHRLTSLTLCTSASLALAACDSPPITLDNDAAMPMPDAAMMVDCTGRPSDAPSPRGELAGVLDEARGRIVVYGGNTAAPVMCMPMYNLVDEMWALHLDCASWERLTPAGGPGVRARAAITTDTSRDRMVLFAGRLRNDAGFGSYVNFNDVWAFDLATDTWSQIETNGGPPAVRSSSILEYDAARDRLIVFGGNSSTSGLTLTGMGDTWALDLATGTWSELTGDAPPARLFHASAIVGDHLYVFGGTPNFDGPFMNDTWALDLTTDTWSEVVTSGDVPATRFGAEMFHDAAGHRLLVAFGHDDTSLGNRNDVYALDLETSTWSVVHPGDTFGGTAGGMCMFPADFTTPEEGAPERRYSFVATQDATHAYVFGGKTDCGNVNDVVSLDFGTDEWTSLRPATGGEACNRSGRIGCTTLCY
ncbi:MAG: hypothetical protein K1X94_01925 [Sandaracinaceae bacterium]|nr:hypothetical protein [Sandaracinaceae bacterium]